MEINEFKIKVLPLKNKLYRFAKLMLRNREEAEDALQNVFAKLWLRRKNLNKFKNIEAFAITVTKNMCIDIIRTRKRQFSELGNYNLEAQELSPYKNTELQDSAKHIMEIMDELNEQQRMIIQLRDIEGYGNKEISEITGLNENVVKVNLSRARKKIREILSERMNYEN